MDNKTCKNCHFVSYKLILGSITFDKSVRTQHEKKWLCTLMRDSNFNEQYLSNFESCELWESR